MRFRKLRIAWSVAWGLVAVLLIALWVRSYVRLYSLSNLSRQLSVSSGFGEISINRPFYSDESPVEGSSSQINLFGRQLYFDSYPAEYVVQDTPGTVVPDRLVVGAALALGVVPWIGWPKRFSLRTLLIATTLVAIVLGLIVAAHNS